MALTSFFRDNDTLGIIAEHVVPAIRQQAPIRIWDAGCASGEEPYTLAMLFAELLEPAEFRTLRIDATDREESTFPQFAAHIAAGIYHHTETLWVPRASFAKYFQETERPGYHQVVEQVRGTVRFFKNDLRTLTPVGSGYGLVVCKNVLLHITEAERNDVALMFARALAPGGFAAFETSQPMPEAAQPYFDRVKPGGAVYRRNLDVP